MKHPAPDNSRDLLNHNTPLNNIYTYISCQGYRDFSFDNPLEWGLSSSQWVLDPALTEFSSSHETGLIVLLQMRFCFRLVFGECLKAFLLKSTIEVRRRND